MSLPTLEPLPQLASLAGKFLSLSLKRKLTNAKETDIYFSLNPLLFLICIEATNFHSEYLSIYHPILEMAALKNQIQSLRQEKEKDIIEMAALVIFTT